MARQITRIWFITAVLLGIFIPNVVLAADRGPVIIGKNDWSFAPCELANPSDAEETMVSLELLQKANEFFETNGVTLALVLVPSKIRIHSDQLPDKKTLNSYTSDKYESMFNTLRAGDVSVANLNQTFLNSPHRNSDTSLFFRLDTHSVPREALLASENVKAEIESNPVLRSAAAATSVVKYSLSWTKKKVNYRARDLVDLLPVGGPSFPLEQLHRFAALREQAGLPGTGDDVGIVAIGSSCSNKSTGYPDGLRDDSFNTSSPKLIIWEIAEREMCSPLDCRSREARYVIDNNEWFSRISALVQQEAERER